MRSRSADFFLRLWLGGTLLSVCLLCGQCASRPVSDVIPAPQQMTFSGGNFTVDGAGCSGMTAALARYLAETPLDWHPDASGPVRLVLTSAPLPDSVRMREGTAPAGEAYCLTVTSDSVRIEASAEAGLFYGIQTLLQLRREDGTVPAVTVTDAPRFAWRGFMMDVSRHFYDTAFLKKQIDALARLKINRLHLHLTDAAGWRLEIRSRPRLTSLAAWRTPARWKDWWFGTRAYAEEGTPGAYGGYYTREQIRELVAYAADRHVLLIPEIEMPGHSEEVLAAYPELSCSGTAGRQGDFCIGNEDTFRFLEAVLTEVTEMFPSRYIHIGGDEAGKAAWKECPRCRARMQREGLEGVDELQSYLIRRIGEFLNVRGRILVGWDEILQGGLTPGSVVMSWRGIQGGLDAVKAGERAVLTPGEYCYYDTYQDAPHTLPEAMGGYLPLEKAYAFEPVPDSLDAASASRILGVQANLWCEYVPTPEHAETMIYPRLFALAETGWTAPERKEWTDFRRRALHLCAEFERDGYRPFALAREFGPRPESRTPVQHLALGKPVEYRSPYYPGYAAGGEGALTDGLRGDWTYGDGRWQGFIRRPQMDVVIDLERETEIRSVRADFMQVCGPEVYLPAEVVISVSRDGETFEELRRIAHTVVRDSRVLFEPFGWEGETRARYVRYQARYGEFGGFVFTDEIVVE